MAIQNLQVTNTDKLAHVSILVLQSFATIYAPEKASLEGQSSGHSQILARQFTKGISVFTTHQNMLLRCTQKADFS